MIDWGLFSKNEPSKNKPRDKVVGTVFAEHFFQYKGTELVGKDEESQVFAMLEGKLEDIVEFLLIDVFEKHGDDKTVDEAHLTAVLQAVAESLEDSEYFSVSDHLKVNRPLI